MHIFLCYISLTKLVSQTFVNSSLPRPSYAEKYFAEFVFNDSNYNEELFFSFVTERSPKHVFSVE